MKPRIKYIWEKAAKEYTENNWADQTRFLERFADLVIEETHQVIVIGGVDDLDGVMIHFEIE